MPFVLVSLFSGTVTLAVLVFAALASYRAGNRPIRTGAHSLAVTRKHLGRGKDSVDRTDTGGHAETDRIVRSHRVQSDRLMDAPTGRLWPSERHRVPPWVPAAHGDPAGRTPDAG